MSLIGEAKSIKFIASLNMDRPMGKRVMISRQRQLRGEGIILRRAERRHLSHVKRNPDIYIKDFPDAILVSKTSKYEIIYAHPKFKNSFGDRLLFIKGVAKRNSLLFETEAYKEYTL